MVGRNANLLNNLDRELPEGLLAHSAWLRKKGYSRQLLNHYVSTGWLEQTARGVFRRPRGTLNWQQAVISLQMFYKGTVEFNYGLAAALGVVLMVMAFVVTWVSLRFSRGALGA